MYIVYEKKGEEDKNVYPNSKVFVRLFDLCLFGFVAFLFLLVSGKGCGLWLWQSLDVSVTLFCILTIPFKWNWYIVKENYFLEIILPPFWKAISCKKK